MTLHSRWIVRGFAALVISLAGAAGATLQRSGGATVQFTAKGPAGLAVIGKGTQLVLEDDNTTLRLKVPLASITTDNGLRDKHMRAALETNTYPDAILSVPRAALRFPAPGARISADAQGSMTIHGVSKPVSFHYDATREGATTSVAGRVPMTMTDFGITPPSYLGMSVRPDVVVTVSFAVNGD